MTSLSPSYAFGRPSDHTREMNRDARIPISNHGKESSAGRCPPNTPSAFPTSSSPICSPTTRSRRRPMSVADIQQSRPHSASQTADSGSEGRTAALPHFSFNPGASISSTSDSSAVQSVLSPPITPNSSRPVSSPVRPTGHGHRRGGSEFVGGNIRDGNSIAIMSTSPTKSDSGLLSSTLHPPMSRIGHRRGVSGAISINDMPFLYPQPDFLTQKGNSAPNTPTPFRLSESTLPPLDDQTCPLPQLLANDAPIQDLDYTEESSITDDSFLVPDSPRGSELRSRQLKSGRARVGFSDTLEFIPRPLSLVSSDTSSTATARPGHTVSGSMSSNVSLSTTSPVDRDNPASLARSPTFETVDFRPSTAGAILEHRAAACNMTPAGNASPRRRNSITTLLDNVTSDSPGPLDPGPPKTPKRWSFFSLEPFLAPTPVSRQQCSFSSSSSESMNKSANRGSSSDHGSLFGDDEAGVYDSSDTKTEREKTSKKKRVKGWAGAILPLRSNRKRSKMLAVRPPTPPAPAIVVDDDDEEEEEEKEEGNVTKPTQATPETETPLITPTVLVTESRSAEDPPAPPRRRRSDEDFGCPVIDLDAALGPFNTPLPRNAEWDAAQQAAVNIGKRRLHSAQGMKGFSGPGMHYHRRAESAPNLPPFECGRTGINRFGSSSTMADVFEEDEEDDGETQSTQSNPDSSEFDDEKTDDSDGELTPPATTKTNLATEPVNESVVSAPVPLANDSRRPSCGTTSSDGASATHVMNADFSKTTLPHEEVMVEETPSIILQDVSVFCAPPIKQSNHSASSSPRLLPVQGEETTIETNQLVLSDNAMAAPLSPHSMSHASSHTSPHSPLSIDVQRISTAPSSVNDENSFRSLLMSGEPGPELRISVDYDAPSITSSTSTMTRESTFIPIARMSQPSLRAERPMSMSSAAFGRRRSSLVSLSRLISSSHGERSKLSMEVTLDNESEAMKSRSKSSKTKRLGRMMQFWKANKENNPAQDDVECLERKPQ